MKYNKSLILNVFKYVTIGLYLVALLLPAFNGYEGYMVLVLGALAIFVTNIFGFLAWTANILLFCSFLPRYNPKTKLLISLTALACGLLTFFVNEILVTEGGDKTALKIAIGFSFWIGSLAANAVMRFMDYQWLNDQLEEANT